MKWSIRSVILATLALATMVGLPCGQALAQPGPGFVRVDPIERGSPANDHPARIEPAALRAALAGIRLKGTALSDSAPVFSEDELARIVPGIADALAKAGRGDDVTFAVFGRHGAFGENSPATVTTGRVFVHEARLNVLLGLVHTRYEDLSLGASPIELKPAQRARRASPSADVFAGGARVVDKRADWLQFEVAGLASLAIPAATGNRAARTEGATAPAASAPARRADAEETRAAEIRNRLKTLDRLKAEGLVTEEEYRDLRRAILQSI